MTEEEAALKQLVAWWTDMRRRTWCTCRMRAECHLAFVTKEGVHCREAMCRLPDPTEEVQP